jgi:hypothetical protein
MQQFDVFEKANGQRRYRVLDRIVSTYGGLSYLVADMETREMTYVEGLEFIRRFKLKQ